MKTHHIIPPATQLHLHDGFTLVEAMFAMGVLIFVAAASITGLSRANQFAAVQRNQSAAKALCQERVEQALKMPFNPPSVLPSVNDINGTALNILGTPGQVWPPATGTVWPNPTAGRETSRESIALGNAVPLYRDENDNAVILATRVTTMERVDATLTVVRFTARVEYTYRGQTYSCEVYTMRSPGKGD